MSISRSIAGRLCTKPELELVEASFPPDVKQLTPGRLRQKVERTRRIRDKYRDLSKRQRLESRGKTDPRRSRPAQGNANTERKATLFDETLGRFEKQLARSGGDLVAGAGASPSGARSRGGRADTASRVSNAAGRAGAKKTGAKKTGAKKTGAKKTGAKKTGASEPNGARRRPDSAQQAQPKAAGAHNRAAGQRSQRRRNDRNTGR